MMDDADTLDACRVCGASAQEECEPDCPRVARPVGDEELEG